MDPANGRGFLQGDAVAQPPVECLLDQEGFIEFTEDFRDRRLGEVARNANCLELAQRPQAPVAFDVRLGAGAGERGPVVVERPFLPEARHGDIDRVWVDPPPLEAAAHLRLRQLTAREHLQARHIGALNHAASVRPFVRRASLRGVPAAHACAVGCQTQRHGDSVFTISSVTPCLRGLVG